MSTHSNDIANMTLNLPNVFNYSQVKDRISLVSIGYEHDCVV